MRRILIIPLCILVLMTIAGCNKKVEDTRKLIVVSIYPYELLVKQLVGDGIRVQTLIPAKASPHTFSPKPRDLKDLQQADLVLMNGYGLETNYKQAFDSVQGKLLKVEDLLKPSFGNESDPNPHVWLSPQLLQRLVIQLNDRLQTSFPELKDTINNNAIDLISQLSALDSRIRQERSTFAKTPIITFHDSFHYFLKDYRIDYLGSIEASPGHEPTPKELSGIGDLIKANGVKVLYVEPQEDSRSARALANEFDLKLIVLDDLGLTFKPKTIMDVILNNWEAMKQGW